MNRIKIDILTLDFSLGGGIERVVSNMATMFANYGNYEVRIVSVFKKNKNAIFQVPSTIPVYYLSDGEYSLTTLKKKIHSNILLCKALKNYESDSIIISTTTNVTQWLSILSKTKNKIVIAAEHGYYWAFGRFSRLMRRITYKKITAVVTLTKSEIDVYKQFVKKVVMIPNSLSFIVDECNNYDSNRVIAAGRAVKEKQFDQLMDIYFDLAPRHKNWSFDLFLGDGYLFNTLKTKSANCIPNIHLKQATNNFKKELLNSEIYICTSSTESFSMTIIEAMSCGVCPVSYKCPPGPIEIINDGINGILIDINNKKEMVECIDKLIRSKDKRIELGRNAFSDSKKYTPERVFKLWDNLIKETTYGN